MFVSSGHDACLAILDEEFVDALLGLFEALLAGACQLDATLKGGERFFQALFAGFHFFDDFFKLGERRLEVRQGGFFGHGVSRGERIAGTLAHAGVLRQSALLRHWAVAQFL
jgi:hypothetical protein